LEEELELQFQKKQLSLVNCIDIKNCFYIKDLKYIAGVDLAYWKESEKEYAVCSIVVIDFFNKNTIETKSLHQEISVPYVPGFLSFRELPLILNTYKLLEYKPDIIMFDGNGYLHYRHMGIATHASFYLKKPTIGVAKSYLKIENINYDMPDNEVGSFTDIIINNEVYGRALRTQIDVKPIFVSIGNWIDLNTTTSIVMKLISKESRLPIPVRLADIETKIMRKKLCQLNVD